MKSIFLSHTHADKAFARELARALQRRGIYVWIDDAEIKVGDSLIEKIREGIDHVDFFGVVLSKTSVRSQWVAKELDVAMNQEIGGRAVKVLPILLEDCDLPSFLVGKLYADFRSDFDTGLRVLCERLDPGKLASPHQPVLRSCEIPIAVASKDQTPEILLTDNCIYLQWYEPDTPITRVFVYAIELGTLTPFRAFAYEVQGDVSGHFLVDVDDQQVSVVVTSTDFWESRVSCVKIEGGKHGVLSHVPKLSSGVDSVVSFNGAMISAGATSGSTAAITTFDSAGVVRARQTYPMEWRVGSCYLASSGKHLFLVLETNHGIAAAELTPKLKLKNLSIVLPGKRHINTTLDTGIHAYGKSCFAYEDTLNILYTADGGEFGVCTVEATRGTPAIHALPRISERPFKQSLTVSSSGILAIWNEPSLESEGPLPLLRCMLFERRSHSPRWPYARTLTTSSNCGDGVPGVALDEKDYVAYIEEALGHFKVKMTALDSSGPQVSFSA